jgi:hypothetical protein
MRSSVLNCIVCKGERGEREGKKRWRREGEEGVKRDTSKSS